MQSMHDIISCIRCIILDICILLPIQTYGLYTTNPILLNAEKENLTKAQKHVLMKHCSELHSA